MRNHRVRHIAAAFGAAIAVPVVSTAALAYVSWVTAFFVAFGGGVIFTVAVLCLLLQDFGDALQGVLFGTDERGRHNPAPEKEATS